MAEIDKWKAYAARLNFPRPEQAEKDYLQEIVLQELYSNNNIIFRGGTAISKFYGSGRFSEDLDFITNKNVEALSKIEESVKNIRNYFEMEYKAEKYKDMIEYNIKIEGPLYVTTGHESARQRIKIDINTYEQTLKKPETIFRTPLYETLRPYTAVVEKIEELLADKVKAAIERKEKHKTIFARDIYDVWIITKKYGLNFDFQLVEEKMKKYGIKKFNLKDFKECISKTEEFWSDEMSKVMKSFPNYEQVKKDLIKSINH